MEREQLLNALLALRDACDNLAKTVAGGVPEPDREKKRDNTVMLFWQALKDKDFIEAKRLYKKFAAMDLTEKQKELKVRMKKALIEKYNQFKQEDDGLPY